MSDLSKLNPIGLFSGRAAAYAKYRPGYPAAAIDSIVERARLSGDSLLVDVGSGTGISSRLFAARGVSVIGIEPNAEMRAAAESWAAADERQRPTYREGLAQATGLPSGVADAVLAAQAFHWFEPDAALREFHRILKPDGFAILMWNERDERDSFTAAFGTVIRDSPGAAVFESRPHAQAASALVTSPLFRESQRLNFPSEQVLDEEEMLGRAFSVSYAPSTASEKATWTERLRNTFREYQREGKVTLFYQTSVYLARRRAE
jgi:SAM-dependent methyltransferase